jgi:uncharacterized protein
MTARKARPAPVHLLDGDVLVAPVSSSHIHHAPAQAWFVASACPFATCPITQGILMRLLMRLSELPAEAAAGVLTQLTAHPRHRFWPDTLDHTSVSWRGVLEHRQVTDACLAALARHDGGKLVSSDRGLVALHADVGVTGVKSFMLQP